jgi:hypothetical protein
LRCGEQIYVATNNPTLRQTGRLRNIRLFRPRLEAREVFPENPRMPSGDAQQGDRRAFRTPPPLLPVPESMNADAHGESELNLGEPDKIPQG